MKREVIIPFRVSAREKEELEKKAAACGWSLSDYIRACIEGKHVTVIEGADALTDELRRIGNNLNQITAKINEYTLATTTNLVNAQTNEWDGELLEKLGIKNTEVFLLYL